MAEAEADAGTYRGGFHVETAYAGHRSALRAVAFLPRQRCFASLDERCVKLWKSTTGEDVTTLHFPNGSVCLLTTLMYVQELGLILAPALDHTLKVYDERLQLMTSMPWKQGPVMAIAYNPTRDELISAGADGVKVWRCTQRVGDEYIASDDPRRLEVELWEWASKTAGKTAGKTATPTPAQDAERGANAGGGAGSDAGAGDPGIAGQGGAWRKGKFAQLTERLSLDLPFVRKPPGSPRKQAQAGGAAKPPAAGTSVRSTASMAQGGAANKPGHDDRNWVKDMYLHVETQVLYVIHEGSVYGYSMESGEHLVSWELLHMKPITAMLVIPHRRTVITAARDSTVKLWRQKPGGKELQMMRTLGQHTKPVVSLALHYSGAAVMTACLDGFVQLWSLDTIEAQHRMKINGQLRAMRMVDDRFYVWMDMEVKFFRLIHFHDTFAQYNSPLVELRPVEPGIVLAVTEDSAVRFVSATNGESMCTTVPQLSTSNLLDSRFNPETRRLYLLLGDGTINVHLCNTNPSMPVERWEQYKRDHPTCIAMCSPSLLPARWGLLDREKSLSPRRQEAPALGTLIIMGTRDGDVYVLDSDAEGSVVGHFPGHRNVLIERALVDEELGVLFTCAGRCTKVWNIREGFTLVHTLMFDQPLSCLQVINGRLLTGHTGGAICMTDLESGELVDIPQSGDHGAPVGSISVSQKLQHFVTASMDGTIKVFDATKRLERALALEAPVSCACYLNDNGDIVAGMRDKLLIVRVNTYRLREAMPFEPDVAEPTPAPSRPTTRNDSVAGTLGDVALTEEAAAAAARELEEGDGDEDGDETDDEDRFPSWEEVAETLPEMADAEAALDAAAEAAFAEAIARAEMEKAGKAGSTAGEKKMSLKKRRAKLRARRKKANMRLDGGLAHLARTTKDPEIIVSLQEYKAAEVMTAHVDAAKVPPAKQRR